MDIIKCRGWVHPPPCKVSVRKSRFIVGMPTSGKTSSQRSLLALGIAALDTDDIINTYAPNWFTSQLWASADAAERAEFGSLVSGMAARLLRQTDSSVLFTNISGREMVGTITRDFLGGDPPALAVIRSDARELKRLFDARGSKQVPVKTARHWCDSSLRYLPRNYCSVIDLSAFYRMCVLAHEWSGVEVSRDHSAGKPSEWNSPADPDADWINNPDGTTRRVRWIHLNRVVWSADSAATEGDALGRGFRDHVAELIAYEDSDLADRWFTRNSRLLEPTEVKRVVDRGFAVMDDVLSFEMESVSQRKHDLSLGDESFMALAKVATSKWGVK